MNSRQLQYAILLAEIRNFSQVAEKLDITQPALSKQILNLEKELGVKLFDRNTSPLSLTPAGEHFIQEAQSLLYHEDQLMRSMARYKSGDEGRLIIGISPFRSLYLIPPIIKKIKDKFPGVQIFLHEANSDILRKEVAEGKYDFAIINLPVDDSILDVITLTPDTLVLAVPTHMAADLQHEKTDALPALTMSACKDLPFVTVGQTQELRKLFDKLCASADFHPHIAMEVVGITTAWAMTRAGIGATILPYQFISKDHFSGDITLFTIKDTINTRQPAIVTRRGQFISEYAKYAIDLLVK